MNTDSSDPHGLGDEAPSETVMRVHDIRSAFDAGVQVGAADGTILPRITWLVHQDDPAIAVPVSIQETTDGNGGVAKRVELLGTVLEALELRAGGPARRKGTVNLTEVDSFIAFLARWGSSETVIYADTAALAFTAVLDDHVAGDAIGDTSWREHRAGYACPRSPEWVAWTALDGKPMSQIEFGDLIEARLEDLTAGPNAPSPLDVLHVARQLTIKTKGVFQRDVNPTNGDSVLVCKTETAEGSTVIPRAFLLAIPVFEGGDRYQIEARVRFVLSDGRPVFTFTLHRRKEIERDAFNEVRAKVAKETGVLVLAGRP